MPQFTFVLKLNDDEKASVEGASNPKVYSAAVKAHEARIKELVKAMTPLMRDEVNEEQLGDAQRALPELREMLDTLADSDEKDEAMEAVQQAEGTLDELQRALSAHNAN